MCFVTSILFQRKCFFYPSLFMHLCTDYSGGFLPANTCFFFVVFFNCCISLSASQSPFVIPSMHQLYPQGIYHSQFHFFGSLLTFLLNHSSSCDTHPLIIYWKCAFLIENIICLECKYKRCMFDAPYCKKLKIMSPGHVLCPFFMSSESSVGVYERTKGLMYHL